MNIHGKSIPVHLHHEYKKTAQNYKAIIIIFMIMQTLSRVIYQLTSWLYPSILTLLIIQSGINITRRFIPLPICKENILGNFIFFPSLPILLILLYTWPIYVGSKFKHKPTLNLPISPKHNRDFIYIAILIAFLLIPFIFIMTGFGYQLYDTYRLLLLSLFFLLLPWHIHTNLAYKNNSSHILIVFIEVIPIGMIFIFISLLLHFVKLSIIFIIISIIIWLSYFLSFVPQNKIGFVDLINRKNPFTRQLIDIKYQKKALTLIGISFLSGIIFFTHAYLMIPRIETFGIYKNAFNNVVEMVKNNQLAAYGKKQYGKERFTIPCQFNYLNSFSNVIVEKQDGLTVTFPIFSIGFGDGSVSFVYRSKPLSKNQTKVSPEDPYDPVYIDIKSLGDSWYWEVWIW